MEQKLFEIKTGIVAVLTAVGAFLGWRGIMVMAWIALMALDYISGTAAACKDGEWASARAREGIWHKMGCVIVVLVAAMADGAFGILMAEIPDVGIEWPDLLLPFVLAWYIITEAGSILENATKLGAPVPGWLSKMLAITVKAVDQAVDK